MDTKQEFLNNVIVQMAGILPPEQLHILEQTILDEMAGIRMEGVTTLPSAYQDEIDGKNAYIIQLFISTKRLEIKTKKQYLISIRKLILLIRNKTLPEMDRTDIRYYMTWYSKRKNHGRPLEPTTINNERRNLSSFWQWMIREGFTSSNPVESVEPLRVVQKKIDYFEVDDILDMRDACQNNRERAILEIFRSTGARIGEIVDITLDQVDLQTGDISVITEKGRRWNTLYLDGEARHYLRKYLDEREDDSPYLIVNSRAPHRKMSVEGLRGAIKRIGKRAGVTQRTRVYPHKWRKTLGMTLINKGCDIGTVQAVLGHANPDVTSRYYAQMTPATVRHIRERVA